MFHLLENQPLHNEDNYESVIYIYIENDSDEDTYESVGELVA